VIEKSKAHTFYPGANLVKNPRSQLNRYKKLLRWENFATRPFTAPMSSGYFLPDFMKGGSYENVGV